MKTILIILGVAVVSGALYYFVLLPMQKKKVVDAIITKYKNTPNFDASREVLMKNDLSVLKRILAGEIK